MPRCYGKALIHTTSLSFLIFIGSQRACWILCLFVWIHSLVNYVFWATTCTWTFSLSRFCNIKIGCATLTKKQQIFLKCGFLFLYAFVFPGAISSMEQKYQKVRMRENKEKHKTSPYKALLAINFLQKQGSWRQDRHHLMVATWVMYIFAV